MTPYVDCVFARKHLEAFVDRELPVNDEVLVESHLRWCTTCSARVQDLQAIGMVVRSRGRREPRLVATENQLTSMRGELLRMADAERHRSWESRLTELALRCADLRFVWPALGASAAVALCIGLAETMWRATAEQQPASLAAMIESLSDPGSDRNPLRLDGAMLVPRVLNNHGAVAHAVLDEHSAEGDDEVFAVAAVVTRDGKVGTYELLQAGAGSAGQRRGARNEDGMADLLDAVRQSRFAPAQHLGQAVAVNVVWLFAKTTVKASAATIDLGVPLAAPVRAPRAVEAPIPAPAEPTERRSDVSEASATA
jgi:predicted anti-sigma-YlaC factor YlaD